MSGAVQGLATQVDELHQGLPKTLVCAFQRFALLLQVGGTMAEHCAVACTRINKLAIEVRWHSVTVSS